MASHKEDVERWEGEGGPSGGPWPPAAPPKAVVLLSGGLDSATALAWAGARGFERIALSVDYGQRHRVELDAARRTALAQRVTDHVVVTVDLRAIGGSALTAEIAVPRGRSREQMDRGIPSTYVPARNTVLLALALGLAESRGAREIVAGMNAVDYSGYPDCRPEYLEAFERLAVLATKAGVEGARFLVQAPLLRLAKAEIIKLGVSLGVDYALTHSCYDPTLEGLACGGCDACRLRKMGFRDARIPDPTLYAAAAKES